MDRLIVCQEKLLQMKKLLIIFAALFIIGSGSAYSQHDHQKKDTTPAMHHQVHGMNEHRDMPSHAFSRNLPMSRNASDTARGLTLPTPSYRRP